MEMLPYDHEQATFDVLCKADATMVQRRNIDVEKKLWIRSHGFNVVSLLSLQHP